MEELNIVFEKENLISLAESIFKFIDDDKVSYFSYKFFSNMIKWEGEKDIAPADAKKLIIKELNLLTTAINMEGYNFWKFQNLPYDILIDFCLDKKNTIPLMHTFKKMLELETFDKLPLEFCYMYEQMVDCKLVNPLENKKSINFFKEYVQYVFTLNLQTTDTEVIEAVKELKENVLLVSFHSNFDIEYKKEVFCYYIENNDFNFENRLLKYVYDSLKNEDFSSYHKKYTVIRDFYEVNEEESIIQNICSTSVQFNIIKNAKSYDLTSDNYRKILEIGHFFAAKKATNILDIENCLDIIGPSIFKTYINSYENNKETQLFVEKYKKFLELLPEMDILPMDILEKDLEEQWNSVSLFVEMNNKAPKKKIIPKKKV